MKGKIRINLSIIGFLLCSLLSSSLKAQDASVYTWFDKIIGLSNTELFNGIGYIEVHRTINENHKFFLANQFLKGTLYYNGQPYFSQLLKYNVFDEILLVQVRDGESESLFQLINDKIDGFEIQGHIFKNIKSGDKNDLYGFYEVIGEYDHLQLLKKHSRTIHQLIEKRVVFYEFKPKDPGYILKFREEYFNLNSRKDVLKVFPGARKEIKDHYGAERSLRKSNPDQFLMDLLRKISPAVQQTNKGV